MRRLTKKNHLGSFNLQQEVRDFFSTFPFALIVKNSQLIRCYCYNPMTRSIDTKCKTCLGTGWIPTIEKHRCWHNIALRGESLPHLIKNIDPANVVVDERAFYFLPEASPRIGDYIVVADFGSDGLPSYHTQQFYRVNYADPKVDEKNILTYYKVSTENDPIDAEIKSFNLYNMKSSIKIVPVY